MCSPRGLQVLAEDWDASSLPHRCFAVEGADDGPAGDTGQQFESRQIRKEAESGGHVRDAHCRHYEGVPRHYRPLDQLEAPHWDEGDWVRSRAGTSLGRPEAYHSLGLA